MEHWTDSSETNTAVGNHSKGRSVGYPTSEQMLHLRDKKGVIAICTRIYLRYLSEIDLFPY